jgi:predicted nucleic acid-binding protein
MYLLDTNILIYHLNRSIPVQSIGKIRQILKNHFLVTRNESDFSGTELTILNPFAEI